jgi:transcription elongation factor GreA
MAEEPVYISKQGLDELKKELDYLTTARRAEIAEAIRQAKEFGDITENSEYENAKEQQAFVEGRIATLQHMVANAVIIGA